MNRWIIVGIVVGLLVITGITAINGITTGQETNELECSDCGNSCDSQRNCGLSTCEAISGGSCGCRG